VAAAESSAGRSAALAESGAGVVADALDAGAADAGAPDAGLPPLQAPGPLIHLPVEGHPAAVVSLPLGATGRRPVIVATHGNYDRPEWQCQVWREIVGDGAFVLCPRGVSRSDSPSADDVRFTYQSNQRLEQELDAGFAALRGRFADYVDEGAVLYTGFSLGAIMGVSIASRRAALYPRLVLIEGGHDNWTPATAKAFAEGGGKRVLFVCAQGGCAADARRAAERLTRAGVEARMVRSKDVGHSYDGVVADETRRALPWALEGDGRWGGL
jgi:dienelactone hydrolase